MKNPQENLIQDAVENKVDKKPGFELLQSQAEKIAEELSSLDELINHDKSVKEKDLDDLNLAIHKIGVEEIEQIPNLKENTKIYQEIRSGNFENSYELTYITNDIAEIVGTQRHVNLSHLKILTDKQAELICKDIHSINLNSLRTITDKIAECLGKTKGRVELLKLSTISDNSAESLSRVGGSLYLGVTILSDISAEYLSRHAGGELILDDLEELSDSSAKSFGLNHKGELRLRNYRIKFSDEAASFLAKHEGRILFHESLMGEVIESRIKKFKK